MQGNNCSTVVPKPTGASHVSKPKATTICCSNMPDADNSNWLPVHMAYASNVNKTCNIQGCNDGSCHRGVLVCHAVCNVKISLVRSGFTLTHDLPKDRAGSFYHQGHFNSGRTGARGSTKGGTIYGRDSCWIRLTYSTSEWRILLLAFPYQYCLHRLLQKLLPRVP